MEGVGRLNLNESGTWNLENHNILHDMENNNKKLVKGRRYQTASS